MYSILKKKNKKRNETRKLANVSLSVLRYTVKSFTVQFNTLFKIW